jgi:MoxR-like ATPase
MPADITGTTIVTEVETSGQRERVFKFQQGPIFGQIVLADEVNRATPKTQSALLEAMQERSVTVGTTTHQLPKPFLVMATQNPIEQEGTYPLPEAQLDRFMFNVVMDYLPEDDEVRVIAQTTAGRPAAIEPLFTGEDVLRFHQLVRAVPIADDMVRYAVRIAAASRPRQTGTPDFVNDWVSWGAGTRAAQFLVLGAKARALLQGRAHVMVEDIQALVAPVLRHRVLLNYRAEADGIRVEEVIKRLVAAVPLPVAK